MFNPTQQQLIEDSFGYLGDVAYFNTAFVAPAPVWERKILADYSNLWQDSLADNSWLEFGSSQQTHTKASLAQLIHCAPDEIAFTKNTTEGMGILSAGYPWQAGDNVVVFAGEHNANLLGWFRLRRFGVVVKQVMAHGTDGLSYRDLMAAVDDQTRVVAVSAVQYRDGAMIDLARLGNFCHQHHVLLAVDAVQAVGRLAIDVQAMNIDWLACASYKGLLAMESGGFLYCRHDLTSHIEPMFIGSQSIEKQDETGYILHQDARRFQNGSLSTLGIMTMGHTVDFLNQLTIGAIDAYIQQAQMRVLNAVPQAAAYGDVHSGTFLFHFEPAAQAQVLTAMKRYRIRACPRSDNVLFCLNFFNTPEQITRLIALLQELTH